MNAGFFKRLGAYLIDLLIINLILSLITFNLNIDNKYNNELSDLTTQYTNGEITYTEFFNQYEEISYNIQKNNVVSNVCQLILTIGYFIVFQTLNKGQTLGKKLLKIRIVSEDETPPMFGKIILRVILTHNILSSLTNIIVIRYSNIKTYTSTISIVTLIETIFLIVTIIFILYNKEKRALHDIITHTKVINE